jgi:hypothetical protein
VSQTVLIACSAYSNSSGIACILRTLFPRYFFAKIIEEMRRLKDFRVATSGSAHLFR